jgi:hypothetical protein
MSVCQDYGIAGREDLVLHDAAPAGTVAPSQADVGRSSAAAESLASGVQQTVLGNDASTPEEGEEQTPQRTTKSSGEGDKLSGGPGGEPGLGDGGEPLENSRVRSGRARVPP